MPLRVGTIVRPMEYYDPEDLDQPDNGYLSCEEDEEDVTHICVGIILQCDEEDALVDWLQFCRKHINETPQHERLEYPKLWEIGQIA